MRIIIDGTTSQSTKPASWQVAGYPAQAGIQTVEKSRVAGQCWGFVRFAEYSSSLDSRLRGNDETA
jgi:hypothetical protein